MCDPEQADTAGGARVAVGRGRARRGAAAAGSDSGSVLMLMPAAVLVLLVLAAVSVDAAIVFMAQRELQGATAAAANDAAVAALDEGVLYECGGLDVAVGRAHEVAAVAFAARVADAVEPLGPPDIDVTAGGGSIEVTVAAQGRVELMFRPALRGAAVHEFAAVTTTAPRLATGTSWPVPSDC